MDLLLICGDFQARALPRAAVVHRTAARAPSSRSQAVRNQADLSTMACPVKYRSMQSFYKYYSGEKVAPMLTIFVGGNHEASSHLSELFYGGWVAPN